MTLVQEIGPALAAGIDTVAASLDPAVRPQDDLDAHVNGRWSAAYPLRGHRAEVSVLSLLSEKVQCDVEQVIRAAADGARTDVAGRQIADLLTSFMDEETIESRGTSVYGADLAELADAADHAALAGLLGSLARRGVPGHVDITVAPDTATASHHVLVLSQGGLGLPAAAHYDAPQFARLRSGYAEHAIALLAAVGVAEVEAVAATALRLEYALACHHVRADARGRDSARPVTLTVAELAARPDGFPWTAWLDGLGIPVDHAAVCLRQSGFFHAFDAWWSGHDIHELRCWAVWRYVHESAPFGPRHVFATNFAFFGKVVIGATEARPRPLRALSLVETVLGDAVGRRYVAQHLRPGTAEAVGEVVGALARTYRARIGGSAWMGPDTKRAALLKLENMVFEIGTPATFEPREELHVDPGDYYGNVVRGREWYVVRELDRLRAPVDRRAWRVHPQQVTAYYRHGLNQVVVPAALLQPPVFAVDGDPTRNFAALGAIIAHEMAHAFDSRGSRFDHCGRVADWWAPADRAEFARRTALLVEHYDGFAAPGVPGGRVSGLRTLGENIADITGVTVALDAYAAHVADRGGVGDVRGFFLHWASTWRAKATPARAADRLATDPHAPAPVRCNAAVGHIEAFVEAFGLQPGDALYVEPERRFSIL